MYVAVMTLAWCATVGGRCCPQGPESGDPWRGRVLCPGVDGSGPPTGALGIVPSIPSADDPQSFTEVRCTRGLASDPGRVTGIARCSCSAFLCSDYDNHDAGSCHHVLGQCAHGGVLGETADVVEVEALEKSGVLGQVLDGLRFGEWFLDGCETTRVLTLLLTVWCSRVARECIEVCATVSPATVPRKSVSIHMRRCRKSGSGVRRSTESDMANIEQLARGALHQDELSDGSCLKVPTLLDGEDRRRFPVVEPGHHREKGTWPSTALGARTSRCVA